jgi:3-oxoacyl-[acyl-carrier-protein] synthase-3
VTDVRASLPVAIVGLGAYLPERRVTNDDIAQVLDTSDEWIRTRTGIRQRYHAAPDQATSDLATEAARKALADAGLTPADLSAVIVATTTPDHTVPGTAPLVAAALGTEAAAFDVNAACSGFLYGLRVGAGMVATGDGPVLVVGAETLTRIVDPTDRAVSVLFGDGAGAAVLAHDPSASLGPFDLGADGRDPSMLWTATGGTRTPVSDEVLAEGSHYLTMRGGDVYRNAVARMAQSASTVLERAGLGVDDIDLFVGHQANVRIIDAVVSRLQLDPARAHITVDKHGNTSAASVPLALADARDAGLLEPGATVLLAAFGAGLTFGACVLTWQGRTS